MKLSISARKAFGEMGTVALAAAATAAVTYASTHIASFDVPATIQPLILMALAALGRYISQKLKHPDPPPGEEVDPA